MKKLITLFLSFISVLSFCNADLGGFTIDGYTADFKLRKDGILEVDENIKVNFSENRHGIYRTIPYIYSTYKKTPIENIEIPGYKFTTKAEGKNLVIKIGDANRTVRGINNYTIQYQIKGTVRNFDGYQELYWNMLGTEWNTPINNFNFSLELPSDLNLKSNEIWVYIGEKGSNNTTKAIKSGNIISNPKPLKLGAREGVTLAVKLPTDYVPTKRYYSFRGIAIISIRSLITFLVIWFSSSELIKRHRKRKELRQNHLRKIRDVIYYTPPKGYTAMEVACIYNRKSNFDIFSAFLFNWIADGYVCIDEPKGGFIVYSIKKGNELKSYQFKTSTSEPIFKFDKSINKSDSLFFTNPEENFWDMCFKEKDINNLDSFEEEDTEFLKEISDEMFYRIHTKFIPNWKDLYKVKRLSLGKYKFKDFFLKKVYGKWHSNWKYILNWIIGISLIIFTYIMIILFTGNQELWSYFGSIIMGVLWLFIIWEFIFNRESNTKGTYGSDLNYISEEGIGVIEQVLGFRKYLLAVEDDELRTLLKDDPTYFEKNLPYAIALDVGDHWIKKCIQILEEMHYSPKGISTSSHTWGDAITSTSVIGDSISSIVKSIDHPNNGGGSDRDSGDRGSSSGGSDGGGSSGGGGGGGGGGSW